MTGDHGGPGAGDPIRIKFTDFWHAGGAAEVRRENPLYRLLSTRYRLELTETPDFLVYSCFGTDYLRYPCVRVFYTGENVRPDYDECDYSFSFDYPVDDRNYRLPLYALYDEIDLATRVRDVDAVLAEDRGFCSFVYSNGNARERNDFFDRLSKYRPVASGGAVGNTVGGPVADKHAFARSYKFAIAFENASHPGYTTEKLLHAFVADAVPIYWGNPRVAEDFNPKAFINCHDFEDFESVVEHVKRVDADEDLYRAYLAEPCFVGNRLNPFVDPENVLARFGRIFQARDVVPVATTLRGRVRAMERRGRDFAGRMRRALGTQVRRVLGGPG